MQRWIPCSILGICSYFLLFILVIAFSGERPSQLPADFYPIIFAFSIMSAVVGYSKEITQGILVILCGCLILSIRVLNPDVDWFFALICFSSIVLGNWSRVRPSAAFIVLIVILVLSLSLQEFLCFLFSIFLYGTGFFFDSLLRASTSFFVEMKRFLSKEIFGLIGFGIIYLFLVLFFTLLYIDISILSTEEILLFEWNNADLNNNALNCLWLSAMTMSGGSFSGVNVLNWKAAALLSTQSTCSLILTLIILRYFLKVSSDRLRKNENR